MNMLTRTFADMTATIQKAIDPTKQRVFRCKSCYRDGPTWHLVLVEGEYYRVDDREFALLNSGMEPFSLNLEPLTDEEAEREDW